MYPNRVCTRVVSILLLYQSKTRLKILSVWNGHAENRNSSKNHGILIRVTTDCIPNQISRNSKWFGYARGRMRPSGRKNHENSSTISAYSRQTTGSSKGFDPNFKKSLKVKSRASELSKTSKIIKIGSRSSENEELVAVFFLGPKKNGWSIKWFRPLSQWPT